MRSPYFYCKSWFRAKKKPTEIWPAERAYAAHQKKQPYTVLVGSVEQPYCFLDVSDGVVGVGFLDDRLREILTYAFQEVAPGRLFLTMATHRQFVVDTDAVAAGTSYLFERDGTLIIRRETFHPHCIQSATSHYDITGNYSDVPQFGCYDDLIHVERN